MGVLKESNTIPVTMEKTATRMDMVAQISILLLERSTGLWNPRRWLVVSLRLVGEFMCWCVPLSILHGTTGATQTVYLGSMIC